MNMSPRLLLIWFVWVISLLSIFGGLVLVSWNVSEEYFLYRTSSHITIEDYPETNITIPELVVCVPFDLMKVGNKSIGELFSKNYFNDQGTWKIEDFNPSIAFIRRYK